MCPKCHTQMGLTSCSYASTRLYHLLLLRMTLIWNNDVSSRAFVPLHMIHEIPNKSKSVPYISNIHQLFSHLVGKIVLVYASSHRPPKKFHSTVRPKVTSKSGKTVRAFLCSLLLWIISWWSVETYFSGKSICNEKYSPRKIKTVCLDASHCIKCY